MKGTLSCELFLIMPSFHHMVSSGLLLFQFFSLANVLSCSSGFYVLSKVVNSDERLTTLVNDSPCCH